MPFVLSWRIRGIAWEAGRGRGGGARRWGPGWGWMPEMRRRRRTRRREGELEFDQPHNQLCATRLVKGDANRRKGISFGLGFFVGRSLPRRWWSHAGIGPPRKGCVFDVVVVVVVVVVVAVDYALISKVSRIRIKHVSQLMSIECGWKGSFSEALTTSFVFTLVASFLFIDSLIFLAKNIPGKKHMSYFYQNQLSPPSFHGNNYASQGLGERQAEIETERQR